MNATLAALHDIDIEAAGLGDFGKPGNYFERQLGRWTSQYRASETVAVPDMDRLIAWLESAHTRDNGLTSLVHGDYRLDNMIFASDGPSVLACSTGNCQRSGIPTRILPINACNGGCRMLQAFRGLGGINRASVGLPVRRRLCRQLL